VHSESQSMRHARTCHIAVHHLRQPRLSCHESFIAAESWQLTSIVYLFPAPAVQYGHHVQEHSMLAAPD